MNHSQKDGPRHAATLDVHIDRLVIDHHGAPAGGQEALARSAAAALHRRIVDALPPPLATEAGADLHAPIAAALRQALSRGRRP